MNTTPESVFVQRLREERSRLGLSQAEFADRLSARMGAPVYPSTITRIEKGERGVKLDEAVAMADVLGLPIAALIDGVHRVDEQIAALQRRRAEQESRSKAAFVEYEQAQSAIADIDQQIADLEASRAQGTTVINTPA